MRTLWIAPLSIPVLALAPVALAVPCVDYGITDAATLPLFPQSSFEDLALAGDALFVATSGASTNLHVVDLSDPAEPLLATTLSTTFASSALVVGSSLYLCGGGQVEIYDVSTPLAPTFLATAALPGFSFATDGTLLFAMSGTTSAPSLDVYDLSTPTAPALTQSVVLPPNEPDMGITRFYGELIADPSHADHVGALYQYGTPDWFRIRVLWFDTTSPAALLTLGTVEYLGGDQCTYFTIVDVAQVGPTTLLSVDTSGFCSTQGHAGILIAGRMGFPASFLGGHSGVDPVIHPGQAVVPWDGTRAFWRTHDDVTDGLFEVDISDPTSLAHVSDRPYLPDLESGVRVGSRVVGVARGAVVSCDPFDPMEAPPVAMIATSDRIRDLEGAGDHVFALYSYGIEAIDVSSPTNPLPLGSAPHTGGGPATDLAVSGSHVYVAGSSLSIFDVSNPAAPVEVGELPMMASFGELAVSGTTVFFADGSDFVVLDVSDPAAPSEVDRKDLGASLEHMGFWNGLAYVLLSTGSGLPDELAQVDPFHPSGPKILGTVGVVERSRSLTLHGGYGYVSGDDALDVVELEAPTQGRPVIVAHIPMPRGAAASMWSDDVLYVTGAELAVLDVATPASPSVIGGYPLDSRYIALAGGVIASGWSESDADRLAWLPLQCGSTAVDTPRDGDRGTSVAVSPNPFDQRMRVSFQIPSRGPVKVAVFDVSGRRVATLADGVFEAGRHELAWRGRGTSAGVYFVRVNTPDTEQVVRAVRVQR